MVPEASARVPVSANTLSEPLYFVSPQGNDSWSGHASAISADASDGPFATVERARDAIRAEKKAHPDVKGGSIYLRGGRYQIQQPILFSGEDSGVRILAFQQEQPELTGAASVTGARKVEARRFEVELPENPGREVFIGGVRQLIAFKPANNGEGWHAVTAPSGTNTFAYHPGDLDLSDLKAGVGIELLDEGRSFDVVSRIISLDATRRVATVDSSDHGPAEGVESFRLLGNPRWVSAKGFFAWNERLHRLTSSPTDTTAIARTGLQVPRLHSLIIFRSSNGNVVSGLRFIETGIAPATNGESAAIVLEHTDNIDISNNKFLNVGEAVRLIGASGSFITHNNIAETGSSGIELQDGSERNAISGNTLTGIGRTDKSSTAIYLHGTASNRISGNLIRDVARHGIGIDNWDDQTINVTNIVEYNKVWKTNQHSFDTGAIEMLGRSRTNTMSIIRYNDVKDVGNPVSSGVNSKNRLTSGIYLDDFTSGVLVCGNLIGGASLAAVQIHGGSRIVIRDNIALLDRPNASFAFLQGGNPTSGGQRFDFDWPASNAASSPTQTHRVEVRFDNDAIVGGQDRDLFVSKILVGSHTLSPTDDGAKYHVVDGRTLPGQVAMPWNGALTWDVPSGFFSPLGKTQISVFAWGNPAGNVGAHFTVKIDSVQVGESFAGSPSSEMRDNVITKNIIYATAPGKEYFTTQQGGTSSISANNYTDTTKSRQLGGADDSPIQIDPKFIDPRRGDYRLRASSNLHAAGFANLPVCETGVLECADVTSKNEAVR